MSPSRIDELKSDVDELSKLLSLATRPRVKDILSLEIRKLETDIIKLNDLTSVNKQDTFTVAKAAAEKKCYDVKLTNYAWDQSEKFVKLFVTLKNVQTLESSQISCLFTRRSVELRVKGLEHRNYYLPINNLLMDIDENKSHWKVKTDMVVVFLSKVEPTHWKHLTLSESQLKESHKKEISDDLDASSDPSQGLMNLMKKMYNEGDDEMKRTIAKAWTEGREKNMSSFD